MTIDPALLLTAAQSDSDALAGTTAAATLAPIDYAYHVAHFTCVCGRPGNVVTNQKPTATCLACGREYAASYAIRQISSPASQLELDLSGFTVTNGG